MEAKLTAKIKAQAAKANAQAAKANAQAAKANAQAAQIKQLTAQIKSLQNNDDGRSDQSSVNNIQATVKAQVAQVEAQLTAKINAQAVKATAVQSAQITHKTASCEHVDRSIQFNSERKFRDVQADLCTVPNLDLADPTVTNVAVIFVDEDIGRQEDFKRGLAATAKFRVADECTADPLFRGKDVAFQQIGGRWAMVVQLDSNAAYLQHEVNDHCENREYIPRTKVFVQVYADTKQCCTDTNDASECFRNKCDIQAVNTQWGKRSLSYKMTLTGNVFEFALDEYAMVGTKYTSATKTNVLEIGKDVNNGDVTNALDEATAVIDLGERQGNGPSEADFAAFKAQATGTCHDMDTKALFAKVVWKEGRFLYNCVEADALCKCISTTGLSTGTVTFEGQKHTLQLIGNGNTLEYLVTERQQRQGLLAHGKPGTRRRRLLQRGSVRGC